MLATSSTNQFMTLSDMSVPPAISDPIIGRVDGHIASQFKCASKTDISTYPGK